MNDAKPQLPPLLVKKNGKSFYVFTYQAQWIPKTYDEHGNAIGGIATTNKRSIIGKILEGKNEGPIKFNDKFLKDYPEFRDYIVSRKGKGSYDIKHIDELSTENAQDLEIINTLVASKEYSINDSGKLIKSATAVPMRKASNKKPSSKQDSKSQKKSCSLSSLVAQYADIKTSIQAINDLAKANISSGQEITLESFKDLHLKHCQLHEKSNALLESLFDKLDEQ